MQLLDGGLLLSKNSLGMIKLQASRPTPPLSKSGLFYGCAWIVCQASIRYQTQRTKIKPREQRKPVEVAICFPLFKFTRANLWAGHCSPRCPFKRGWCLRKKHKAFEKSSEKQPLHLVPLRRGKNVQPYRDQAVRCYFTEVCWKGRSHVRPSPRLSSQAS